MKKALVLLVCALLTWPATRVAAQGVTTGAITGVVKDSQGAVIPGTTVVAVHQPSGTSYEAVTQGDGRYNIPGMRVGGPYKSHRHDSRIQPRNERQHHPHARHRAGHQL
jgi:hypothetical protein